MFLYHQSVLSTPRFNALIEKAPPIPFARLYLKLRRNQYKESRIMGAYRKAQEFYWHPKNR